MEITTSEKASPANRILLIEDNEDQSALLTRWLERDGDFSVTVSHEGLEGIQKANEENWDLIISDVQLPGLDGLELARQCKKLKSGVPILMITANDNVEFAITALRNKVDDFLLKPFNRATLVEKVTNLIAESKQKNSALHKTVLAIGAHPDDVEIGCGGALLRHRKNGDQVVILTLTDGHQGGEEQIRRQESIAASEMIGAKLFWGGLSDTKVADGQETISIIESVIKDIQPATIYTHTGNDSHQDHRNAHNATIVAARRIPNLYCYESPSATTFFRPTTFVDISEQVLQKIDLVQVYETQTSKCPYLAPDLINATARYWGRFAGYKLVEAMEVIRESK